MRRGPPERAHSAPWRPSSPCNNRRRRNTVPPRPANSRGCRDRNIPFRNRPRLAGIRCGIGYNDEVSHLLREHNDANMIAFGANFMGIEDIKRRIIIFLNSQFEGDRHIERVNTIKNYEK